MMQRLIATFIIASALLTSGCSHYKFPWVYRIDIEQGNIVDKDDFEQVKIGMTEKQVEYLLGSPIIEDTFNQDRWDYFYSYQTGKGEYTRSRITLFFKDEKLASIERREEERMKLTY